MPRHVSADRAGLLLKSAVAAVGLIALMGCTTANAGANAGDQASANSGGTQNTALLMHMGVSDTSYSSQNGDHGGSNFRRHHHS